jgi:hypothetical protein
MDRRWDILEWIEHHPGTAAWVGAVGTIVAILAAIVLSRSDRRERLREKRLRGTALAVSLHAEVLNFSQVLEEMLEDDNAMVQHPIQTPTILIARHDDLYLLGEAGGHLLQMLSALNVSNDQLNRLKAVLSPNQSENDALLRGIRANLQIALEDCHDAVNGLAKIIRASKRSRCWQASHRLLNRRRPPV